jgi:hypothetical protein
MIEIGPYRFTEHDARRTVDQVDVFWSQLASGRGADVLPPPPGDLDGPLDEVLPRVWGALLAAGPALRAAGRMPARSDCVVATLHAGSGGVPKPAVDSVEVDWRGVVGDVQATRKHHGRPWQALCLWSGEVIDAFAAAGHPLAPGLAGENVTLRGLDWGEVRCGVRLRIGTVLCEASLYALPCSQNTAWFTGGDFRAMHHDRGPVSRVYATVLEPGRIAVGDAAILEP